MNEWIKSYNSLPVCPMFYQTPISYNPITPQVKMNEGMNECWEKPQRCMCMSNVLAFFTSQRGDLKFDTNAGLQLSLKYLQLSLRRYIIHWEHRGPNICHEWIGRIYSDTEFYIGWTIASYLNMKVLMHGSKLAAACNLISFRLLACFMLWTAPAHVPIPLQGSQYNTE